eukprot:SAG25_NODE_536_length_7104_cov_4.295789_4_plen_419_part_00
MSQPPEKKARTEASPVDTPRGEQKLFSTAGLNATLIKDRAAIYARIKGVARIPELDYAPTARYVESTKERVLYPLIEDSNCIMVPGAYFGDEGKGKTVDAIARHPEVKVVARVNSGENAGHTVFGPTGVKYDFHLCPSGLLTPGKVNVIGPECVMDPVSFMEREVSQLTKTNVEYRERLFVGNVHIVCPHHKALDLIKSWDAPNKSTLQGMAPVHASKASRRGLRLDHLFNDRADATARLAMDMKEYYGALAGLGVSEAELLVKAKQSSKMQKHVLDFIAAKDKAIFVFELFDRYVVSNDAFPPRADVSFMLRQTVSRGEKVLLEGPQSYVPSFLPAHHHHSHWADAPPRRHLLTPLCSELPPGLAAISACSLQLCGGREASALPAERGRALARTAHTAAAQPTKTLARSTDTQDTLN